MKSDQVKRLKELEIENAWLRRAVPDLTLDKPILAEATRGNFQAPPVSTGPCSASTRGAETAKPL